MAKKKVRGTPPRRAKRKPAQKTPAVLVPRTREVVGEVVDEPMIDRRIDDTELLGELGLQELKLTDREEKILSRTVDESKVRIRPDGVVYLPHIEYTRWFNEAFGRGGWAIVPTGRAEVKGGSLVVPYVLFVHRKPVAAAKGEQEYFDNNRGQSYGDALESTVASALRRCAKRFGVSLDLWDRDWTRRWQAEHAVAVKVRKKKRSNNPQAAPEFYMATEWRRRDDPPLPFEKGVAREEGHEEDGPWSEPPEQPRERPRRQRQENRPEPDAGTHQHAGDPITLQQRDRLVTIVRNSGRDDDEVKKWLKRAYDYKSTAEIKRSEYDRICRAVEASGSLPAGRA